MSGSCVEERSRAAIGYIGSFRFLSGTLVLFPLEFR